MLKTAFWSCSRSPVSLGALTSAQKPLPPALAKARVAAGIALGDWPEARGPSRDGISKETGLVEKWALNGENFLWRAPHGGRSAPVVMGNRVYVQNPSGRGVVAAGARHGARRRHRQASSGNTSSTSSRATCRRIASAGPPPPPIRRPATSTRSASAPRCIALSKDGKLLWERSVGEEFAAFTTHGGRTMSPLVDGDLVIVSAAISSWGTQAQPRAPLRRARQAQRATSSGSRQPGRPPVRHRLCALPLIATINGTAAAHLPAPATAAIHAHEAADRREGLELRRRPSARSTPASPSPGTTVIVSHGDENLDIERARA